MLEDIVIVFICAVASYTVHYLPRPPLDRAKHHKVVGLTLFQVPASEAQWPCACAKHPMDAMIRHDNLQANGGLVQVVCGLSSNAPLLLRNTLVIFCSTTQAHQRACALDGSSKSFHATGPPPKEWLSRHLNPWLGEPAGAACMA